MTFDHSLSYKVLIVDDDRGTRLIYRKYLSAGDVQFECLEAGTGQEALSLHRSEHPDCILLDYQLPDLNGIELLELLIEDEDKAADCAVVLVTSEGDEELAANAIKKGAYDYVSKEGLGADELRHRLLTAIKLHKQRQQNRFTLDELERSNKELENFARVIAHDLKSPLQGVVAGLQVVRNRINSDKKEDALEYIEVLERGVSRMNGMIDGVLNFARISARSGVETVSIDLDVILAKVEKTLLHLIESTNTHITKSDLPQVIGAPSLLFQLFQNLIENAIKYRSDKPPRIEITWQPNQGMAEIIIKDNGVGISEKDQKRVFSIFERGRHANQTEGHGVGLAVVHKVIETHGGTIWLESTPGHGSVFRFTLPLVSS